MFASYFIPCKHYALYKEIFYVPKKSIYSTPYDIDKDKRNAKRILLRPFTLSFYVYGVQMQRFCQTLI